MKQIDPARGSDRWTSSINHNGRIIECSETMTTKLHPISRPGLQTAFPVSCFPRILEGVPTPTNHTAVGGEQGLWSREERAGERDGTRGTPTEARGVETLRGKEKAERVPASRPSLLRHGELFRALHACSCSQVGEGRQAESREDRPPRYHVRDTFRMFCSQGGKGEERQSGLNVGKH